MQHVGHNTHAADRNHAGMHHYRRFLIMIALSFIAMYTLMYAMVDSFGNVFNNVNQVYMAALMTAPMVLLELTLMGAMYPNKRLNIAIAAGSAIALLLCWAGIRYQAGVTDQQFVRSMIPHHAGAVLMCTRNQLHDPELQQLCANIIRSQQSEIELMKAKMR